jgi:hypothetical protein
MDDHDRIALEAAKYIWLVRDKPTPSGDFPTWAAWFEFKFGMSLDQAREIYHQKLRGGGGKIS